MLQVNAELTPLAGTQTNVKVPFSRRSNTADIKKSRNSATPEQMVASKLGNQIREKNIPAYTMSEA